jgi:cell division protein FtsZ
VTGHDSDPGAWVEPSAGAGDDTASQEGPDAGAGQGDSQVPSPRADGEAGGHDRFGHADGPSTVPASDSAGRSEPAAARAFESASTRRRSVVFEEDDDLDVPDFLK